MIVYSNKQTFKMQFIECNICSMPKYPSVNREFSTEAADKRISNISFLVYYSFKFSEHPLKHSYRILDLKAEGNN